MICRLLSERALYLDCIRPALKSGSVSSVRCPVSVMNVYTGDVCASAGLSHHRPVLCSVGRPLKERPFALFRHPPPPAPRLLRRHCCTVLRRACRRRCHVPAHPSPPRRSLQSRAGMLLRSATQPQPFTEPDPGEWFMVGLGTGSDRPAGHCCTPGRRMTRGIERTVDHDSCRACPSLDATSPSPPSPRSPPPLVRPPPLPSLPLPPL